MFRWAFRKGSVPTTPPRARLAPPRAIPVRGPPRQCDSALAMRSSAQGGRRERMKWCVSARLDGDGMHRENPIFRLNFRVMPRLRRGQLRSPRQCEELARAVWLLGPLAREDKVTLLRSPDPAQIPRRVAGAEPRKALSLSARRGERCVRCAAKEISKAVQIFPPFSHPPAARTLSAFFRARTTDEEGTTSSPVCALPRPTDSCGPRVQTRRRRVPPCSQGRHFISI